MQSKNSATKYATFNAQCNYTSEHLVYALLITSSVQFEQDLSVFMCIPQVLIFVER